MINLLFALWLAWFSYKGARAGSYIMLIGLLAFVLAYGLCFVWTDDLASALRTQGINALYALPVAAIVLFGGTSLVVNVISRLVLYLIPELKQQGLSLGGAVLGLLFGLASGVLLVWAFGFVRAALEWEQEPTIVEQQANRWVGALADKGVELAGVEGIQAQATKAMFKDPSRFTRSLKSLSESKELKHFIHSSEVQKLMIKNDIAGLQQSSDFQALLAQPGMAALLDGDNSSEHEVASQLTDVWQRMQMLKHDPEVQSVLRDPEVKKLVEEGEPLSLLANEKMQMLVNRVLEMDMSEVNLSQLQGYYEDAALAENERVSKTEKVEPAESGHLYVETPPPIVEQEIYQWRDNNGRLQFSDFQSIPPDKRATAKRMVK